ncbi:MAG: maleylpyruvate isomerase family mycothiol-dependent enzyme [Acidimicrobiales bacterium]
MIPFLSFEDQVAAIERESCRLGAIVADALDAPVPSCPEWRGQDLIEHVAGVFTFWAHQLAAGDPTERHDPPDYESSAASDAIGWLDASTGVLVEALGELGPEEPCWNWSGSDLESAWVARRMALEVAVHRHDGEVAVGEPRAIPADLAVDGIAEKLEVHLRADVPESPDACLGGPVCLCCADVDAAWVVEVGNGRVRSRRGSGPAAAVLRGSASNLFLFTWNRVGLDELELTGDISVAQAWANLPV